MRALLILVTIVDIYGLRLIPERIPLPDLRPAKCPNVAESLSSTGMADGMAKDKSRVALAQVSIVIPTLNETWEHTSQTFLAILANTPHELVKEIIMVSDGGDTYEAELLQILNHKINLTVIQNSKREGLIRSKNRGAAIAKADILLFFEPHALPEPGWLQPLIIYLQRNPNGVAQPGLDIWGDDNHFTFTGTAYYRLEWNFEMIVDSSLSVPNDQIDATPIPVSPGGIFAIRKQRFKDLGMYDDQLEQWGGEQIEMAFKSWRCGGRIDLVPCSRVAHYFRKPSNRPYDVSIPTLLRNYRRLVEIWFDDKDKEIFFKLRPTLRNMDYGDISEQKSIVEHLNCKPMDWYLEYVDWEMGWEADKVCNEGPVEAGGCAGHHLAGHSSIDQKMPPDLFQEKREHARKYFNNPNFWQKKAAPQKLFLRSGEEDA
eukprot:GEMP01035559.1.p1 GENE.GEMP01035559.1~~GEMP01035559.1.p1  ORF type:complete len:429 (+),score=54.29 GEMP01035559.1:307-1593(+)